MFLLLKKLRPDERIQLSGTLLFYFIVCNVLLLPEDGSNVPTGYHRKTSC